VSNRNETGRLGWEVSAGKDRLVNYSRTQVYAFGGGSTKDMDPCIRIVKDIATLTFTEMTIKAEAMAQPRYSEAVCGPWNVDEDFWSMVFIGEFAMDLNIYKSGDEWRSVIYRTKLNHNKTNIETDTSNCWIEAIPTYYFEETPISATSVENYAQILIRDGLPEEKVQDIVKAIKALSKAMGWNCFYNRKVFWSVDFRKRLDDYARLHHNEVISDDKASRPRYLAILQEELRWAAADTRIGKNFDREVIKEAITKGSIETLGDAVDIVRRGSYNPMSVLEAFKGLLEK